MVARLFHAPLEEGAEAIGAATVGSSEAFMLAGLAMKRRWQNNRKQLGLPITNPNLVCGANVQVFIDYVTYRSLLPPSTSKTFIIQVAIEKFANYFEVQLRTVAVSRHCLCMDPKLAIELCDENTIGVVAILGSTYTGHFEDVNLLNDLLGKTNEKNG